MDTEMIIWISRVLERLAVVSIAGVLIYFGYKLFLNLPDKTDAEGKVVLPGNVSVYLSRIGPGAFFALFGAVIMVYTILNPARQKKADEKGNSEEIVYGLPSKPSEGVLLDLGANLEMDISGLNELSSIVANRLKLLPDTSMGFELAVYLDGRIPQIKKNLIVASWKKEWGDREVFTTWVESGAGQPAPDNVGKAAAIFYQGKP